MSVVRPSFRRRVPVAALLILALSILMHLALLRSVSGWGVNAAADADLTGQPVIVRLQPALAPLPAQSPAPPAKPVRKRSPKRKAAPAPVMPITPVPSLQTETPALPAPPIADEAAPQPAEDSPPGGHVLASVDAAPQDDVAVAPQAPKTDVDSPPPLRALPPPSATLHYNVQARRRDGNYEGGGTIRFTQDGSAYSVEGEVKLMFFTLLSFQSQGEVQPQGLAPVIYTEKRFRRPATNTHFQRGAELVSFSASTVSYARSGLEQDRASIVWQLASLGHGDPAQLAPATELVLFVAGTRDGDTWHLQVTGEEQMAAAGGMQRVLHVVRHPRPGSYDQKLDIWLAPDLHWYPVKLRFTEPNGDELDLSLSGAPEAAAAN